MWVMEEFFSYFLSIYRNKIKKSELSCIHGHDQLCLVLKLHCLSEWPHLSAVLNKMWNLFRLLHHLFFISNINFICDKNTHGKLLFLRGSVYRALILTPKLTFYSLEYKIDFKLNFSN